MSASAVGWYGARYEGVFDAVAPMPVTNGQFTRALGHALQRPTPFPVPAIAPPLGALGVLAQRALIASQLEGISRYREHAVARRFGRAALAAVPVQACERQTAPVSAQENGPRALTRS